MPNGARDYCTPREVIIATTLLLGARLALAAAALRCAVPGC